MNAGRYPDCETYRALYRRYYDGRNVSELLDLLEPLAGTLMFDLCGGDGALSLAAAKRGATAILVEAEKAMIPPGLESQQGIRVYHASVESVLGAYRVHGETVERMACRQAVNYWLDERSAWLAAAALAPHGVFAFNTFNQRPPERPRALEYELDGHAFTEVSWLVGDLVHHLQARDGMAPHHTSFRWLSPTELHRILEPYFTVAEIAKGKTSLYRCVKK